MLIYFTGYIYFYFETCIDSSIVKYYLNPNLLKNYSHHRLASIILTSSNYFKYGSCLLLGKCVSYKHLTKSHKIVSIKVPFLCLVSIIMGFIGVEQFHPIHIKVCIFIRYMLRIDFFYIFIEEICSKFKLNTKLMLFCYF